MSETAKEFVGPAPETFEEAIERTTKLIEQVPDFDFWNETEGAFVAMLHHNLGQHIRNHWGLWSQDSGLYKELSGKFMLSHADDLSGLIFRAVYRRKNDIPLELEESAAATHEFWAKSLRGEPITMNFTLGNRDD